MDCDETNQQPVISSIGQMWSKVFDYLPVSDLLNASLVCRRWIHVISTTDSLMEKIRLNLKIRSNQDEDLHENETFEAPSNLIRQYQHVIVEEQSIYGKTVNNSPCSLRCNT